MTARLGLIHLAAHVHGLTAHGQPQTGMQTHPDTLCRSRDVPQADVCVVRATEEVPLSEGVPGQAVALRLVP